MNGLMCIIVTSKDGHKHLLQFDSESIPLLREKLYDMVMEDLLDFDVAEFVMQQACDLASEMEDV